MPFITVVYRSGCGGNFLCNFRQIGCHSFVNFLVDRQIGCHSLVMTAAAIKCYGWLSHAHVNLIDEIDICICSRY